MSHFSDIDWHALADEQRSDPNRAHPRYRMRWLLAVYAIALLIVLGRAVQLEVSNGRAFREVASRPIEKQISLPAERGRILARDGTVLAADREAHALAIQFRYLQSPPDARWLRARAKERLSRQDRRDPRAITAAEANLREQLESSHARLAELCGVTQSQWNRRTARIQRRVELLAESVNRRRREKYAEQTSTVPASEMSGVLSMLAGLFSPPERLPPAEITVAEETSYHRIVDELSPEVAAEIEGSPDDFPGVKVVRYTRRNYPQGELAANVLGHVGVTSSARSTMVSTDSVAEVRESVGRLGIEAEFESRLRGNPGRAMQAINHQGELLETSVEKAPAAGHDVVLALDAELQRFAEQLLDRFTRRRSSPVGSQDASEQGGSIVVMDVRSGEMLVAASTPRFDPNWFATGDARVEAVLNDAGRPMFDRALRMAIPPGSVFKTLSAIALLEHGTVRPETVFACRGYLDEPQHMRCQLFRHYGVGHGETVLADALAQSCNVYFFHHARVLGPEALLNWTDRLGFGTEIDSDLGRIAGGRVPTLEDLVQPSAVEFHAVGQGSLTVTPLEILRMYVAVANGGYLLQPKFVLSATTSRTMLDASLADLPEQARITGLDPGTIEAVRAGLRQTVEDPSGTGYADVRIDGFPIAGKTGTAETGDEQDHAWFAGYAPADTPRVAFVVALEHGGSGAASAGALARGLVQRMRQLSYFKTVRTAEKEIPPGKG